MNVLSRLQIEEGIESCLICSLCAHPLEVASVSEHRLYKLELTLCTYDHTVLLKNSTHFYHLLERWWHHFGIIRAGVNLLNVTRVQEAFRLLGHSIPPRKLPALQSVSCY